MIGVGRPPINAKVFRIVNDEVKTMLQQTSGLLQIGSCNLHAVNNSFLKGWEVYGYEVVDLIIGVYYYFHEWPFRNEEQELAQAKKGIPHRKFINRSSTWWLTLGPAALRLLEQLQVVIYNFMEYILSKIGQNVTAASSYKKGGKFAINKNYKSIVVFCDF